MAEKDESRLDFRTLALSTPKTKAEKFVFEDSMNDSASNYRLNRTGGSSSISCSENEEEFFSSEDYSRDHSDEDSDEDFSSASIDKVLETKKSAGKSSEKSGQCSKSALKTAVAEAQPSVEPLDSSTASESDSEHYSRDHSIEDNDEDFSGRTTDKVIETKNTARKSSEISGQCSKPTMKTVAQPKYSVKALDSSTTSESDSEDDCVVIDVKAGKQKKISPVFDENTDPNGKVLTSASSVAPTDKKPIHTAQPRVTSGPSHRVDQSQKNCSRAAELLKRHEIERQNIASELNKKKSLVRTTNLSVLPDRGAKMKEQMLQLSESLRVLDLKISEEKRALASSQVKTDQRAAGRTDTKDGAKVIVIQPSQYNSSRQTMAQPETKFSTDVHKTQVNSARTAEMLKRHEAEKLNMSAQLKAKQSLMKTTNLNVLPDKGAKLKEQVLQLSEAMRVLDLKISDERRVLASSAGGAVSKTSQNAAQPTHNHSSQSVGREVRNVAGQVLPSSYRQTQLTDHVTAMSASDIHRMLAQDRQQTNLYGGRMTSARLTQVGQVTNEALERIHSQLKTCPAQEEESADPPEVKVPLMPHQRHALAWLSWREQQEPSGGILADDMGLGKTLTMISLVLKQRTPDEKDKKEGEVWHSKTKQLESGLVECQTTLIVCPASVVHQWNSEIDRRCQSGSLSVIMYHGANREKDFTKLAGVDVVLTTYDIVRREAGLPEHLKKDKTMFEMPASDKVEGSDVRCGLLRLRWRRIILDEAHAIKNHKSQTALAVSRLPARSRWALTGTPIHNDLLDMYSLLRFLRCSPFDEYKVWKKQVDNQSSRGTQRLNTLIQSLLLRRTKSQTTKHGKPLVALPAKHSQTHELVLDDDERRIYAKIYEQSRSTVNDYLRRQDGGSQLLDSKPLLSADKPGTGSQHKTIGSQILLLLLRLRQCCSHMSLMKDAVDASELQQEGIELDLEQQLKALDLNEVTAREPQVSKTDALFKPDYISSKMSALLKEIKLIQSESDKDRPSKSVTMDRHVSVIVSQWTVMLEVVERHLRREGLKCLTIRGNVPPKTRDQMVQDFNTNPRGSQVMLLSLRAGGVGLNLVGGNHLFLIDMHWNPALEQQACDRIYRMGQKKDVHIHRFICKDTIEEKILQLQQSKLKLADNVLSGAGASGNKLSLADLRSLFDLDRPSQSSQPEFNSAKSWRPY